MSSTFSDMHAERDHLVAVVFPELRERLDRIGLQLFDVDLRWGVPETGVDGDKANSWLYCRNWIDQAEPFFIALLAQRYGYVPPPDRSSNGPSLVGRSITELEIRHAFLESKRRPRSYFYFRRTAVPEDAPSDIYGRFVDSTAQQLLGDLKAEIEACGRPVRRYTCAWMGTGFADLELFGDMVLEDLWSGVLREPKYVNERVWIACGIDPKTDPMVCDDSRPVPRSMWERLVKEIEAVDDNSFDAEAHQMELFVQSRLRWFHGRQFEMNQVLAFVEDSSEGSPRLCVVTSPPGGGKSAFLARIAVALKPGAELVSHFVGVSSRTENTRGLLNRFLYELEKRRVVSPEEPERDSSATGDRQELARRLAQPIASHVSERKLVLLIDAVDQLLDGEDLRWLPDEIGPSVRVVLSCADNSTCVAALASRSSRSLEIALPPLSNQDVRQTVEEYLRDYGKDPHAVPVDVITGMEQAANPLYLRVMLDQIRTLGGDDLQRKVPELVLTMRTRYPRTVDLFDWLLARLEVFGEGPVRLWFAYLTLGRGGMSSDELARLLERKLGQGYDRIAYKIQRAVRGYLQTRGAQFDFFHRQFRESAEARFLRQRKAEYHADIASLFASQWQSSARHAISEVVYHQIHGGLVDDARRTVLEYSYLRKKIAVFDPQEYVEDCRLVTSASSGPEDIVNAIRLLAATVRVSSHILRVRPDQLCAQLSGRLFSETNPILRGVVQTAQSTHVGPSFRPLSQCLTQPSGLLLQTFEVDRSITTLAATSDLRFLVLGDTHESLEIWDLARSQMVTRLLSGQQNYHNKIHVVLAPGGQSMASASLKAGRCIWHVPTGRLLRKLEGRYASHEPKSVAISPDGNYVVYANGVHAEIFDLHTGSRTVQSAIPVDRVSAIWQTPGGPNVVLSSYREWIQLWDMTTGRELRRTRLTSEPKCLVGSNSGAVFCSDGSDGALAIWTVTQWQPVRTIPDANPAGAAAFSPDDRYVAAALDHASVGIWEVSTGRRVAVLVGHEQVVSCISFVDNGTRVLTGSEDGTLRLWTLPLGQASSAGHVPGMRSIRALCSNGLYALLSAEGAGMEVWHLESGESIARLWFDHVPTSHEWINTFFVDSSRRRVMTDGVFSGLITITEVDSNGRAFQRPGGQSRELMIWDSSTGKLLAGLDQGTEDQHDYRPVDLARQIPWLRNLSGPVKEKYGQFRAIHTSPRRDRGLDSAIAFTPDGRFVWVGVGYKDLQIWEIPSGQVRQKLSGHEYNVAGIAISPDGYYAASGCTQRLFIWEALDGSRSHELRGHDGQIHALTFTPDSCYLVSASGHGTLQVWEVASGKLVRNLAGCEGRTNGLSVSPDGRFVAAVSDLKWVQAWELTDGKLVAEFRSDHAFQEFVFAADGRKLFLRQGSELHRLELLI